GPASRRRGEGRWRGRAAAARRGVGQTAGRPQGADELLSRGHELGRLPLRGLRGEAMAAEGQPAFAGTMPLDRREFFQQVSGGLCGAALAYLFGQDLLRGSRLAAAEGDGQAPAGLAPRPPHFAAKARSVIHLFMNGGPSQMDLFDPKPALDRHHGKPYFDKIAGEVEFIKGAGALMRSPFKFARHGRCGAWVSEARPALAGRVA